MNTEFPAYTTKEFTPVFRTLKEAKEEAARNGITTKPVKLGHGYQIKYTGKVSNSTRTGRAMNVLTMDEGKVIIENRVITLTYSIEEKGRYMIDGYTQPFKNLSNWDADVYVDYDLQTDSRILATIKQLQATGRIEYHQAMEAAKPSRHFIQAMTMNEWDKAKEAGVI